MVEFVNSPEIIQKFITYMDSVQGKSENTTNAYFSDLRTFFRYIKVHKKLVSKPKNFESSNVEEAKTALMDINWDGVDIRLIKSITLEDIYSFLSYTNRIRKNSANARARKIATLRKFFSFLSDVLEIIPENVAKKINVPKTAKKLPVYLELDEGKKLITSSKLRQNPRDYLIIVMFLNCGMRLSELCGINITDIRGDTLVVTGKGNKQRTVYLNKAVKVALQNYLSHRMEIKTDDPALFLNKNKKRLGQRGVQLIVDKAFDMVGIDKEMYSTHKLRHTAATLMYKYGGTDIRTLQAILGHEQLSTTEIYTHIDDCNLRDAAELNPLAEEI